MGLFHLIWSIIVGFFVGLIARAIIPGVDKMGLITTTLVGIGGSIVGGFIGGLVSKPKEGSRFHPAGILLSIVGALIILFLWRRFF